MSTSLLPATTMVAGADTLDPSRIAASISPELPTAHVSELPFRLSDSLHGRRPAHLTDVTFTAMEISGKTFNLLTSVDQAIFDQYVGLAGHTLDEDIDHTLELIAEALRFVRDVSGGDFELLAAFTPNWAKLRKLPGAQCRLITSCSLPDLPLISFLSHMAWQHIPPRTVAPDAHVVYVAENMVHEAVHQMVNFHILTSPVLDEGYDAASSPKIEIPWRADAKDARNRSWEVDRAVHAATVYCHILGWRTRILEQGFLPAREEQVLIEASRASISSLRVLIEGIQEHLDCLTNAGCYMFGQLSREAARRCEEFGEKRHANLALVTE